MIYLDYFSPKIVRHYVLLRRLRATTHSWYTSLSTKYHTAYVTGKCLTQKFLNLIHSYHVNVSTQRSTETRVQATPTKSRQNHTFQLFYLDVFDQRDD